MAFRVALFDAENRQCGWTDAATLDELFAIARAQEKAHRVTWRTHGGKFRAELRFDPLNRKWVRVG